MVLQAQNNTKELKGVGAERAREREGGEERLESGAEGISDYQPH